MSIMNRRNAMLGWATWTVLKRVIKRGAREDAEAVAEETKRRFRRRKGQVVEVVVEPKKKRRKSRAAIALLAATAIGVAAWMGARRGTPEPVE